MMPFIIVVIVITVLGLMTYAIARAADDADEVNTCNFCPNRWEKDCPLNGGKECCQKKEIKE